MSSTKIVIDNGSGTIKVGFHSDLKPVAVSSVIGRSLYRNAFDSSSPSITFFNDDAQRNRGIVRLKRPIQRGVVTDWNDMECIWDSIFQNVLKCDPKEHAVVITESPLNPKVNGHRIKEIMFETFNVHSLYIHKGATLPVLSLCGKGQTSGLILDSGHEVTHCVPIYDGQQIDDGILRADLGGNDVTDYFLRLLAQKSYFFEGRAEREIVREIKERVCGFERKDIVEYELPDGTVLLVREERYEAPELVFDPKLNGMNVRGFDELISDSVMKCAPKIRSKLLENVVLSGGNTLFEGMAGRLEEALEGRNGCTCDIGVSAPDDRLFSIWKGAAVLASMPSFDDQFITKSEV